MNILAWTAILALGRTFHLAAALNITICNCERAEIVGLMDIQQPAYCDKNTIEKAPVIDKYEFFITEKPHAKWKGHLCMTWIKERKINDYFFGSYDTIDSMRIEPVSAEECMKMVHTHDCAGNAMEETKNKLFSFRASPRGEGSWMRTVDYAVRNCVVQEITLKKDCINCPITSPYGVLTNSSEATSVVSRDSTIVWDLPTWQDDEKCSLKKVQAGMGIITELREGSRKLTDESNQLEFHFEKDTLSICNHNFHKLKNIQGAYVVFQGITDSTGTHLYNKDVERCLNYESVTTERCAPTDTQKFNVIPNLSLQAVKASNTGKCFGFTRNSFSRRGCNQQLYKDNTMLIWNSETQQITDGKQCLEARKETVVATSCKEKPAQQWLLEAPKHQDSNTEMENQPLLAQHHQFIQDKLVEQNNALQEEIQRMHCGNLQVRRYTTQLLAETSGLLAAMANNLPVCHRLKPNGKNLIVQKCEQQNITVTAKQTKCGFEPRYQEYTIGRDGYSLHPFQECFWKDRIVNLNGRSYRWNAKTNKWEEEYPTFHLASLKLAEQFNGISDNEYQYATQHHAAEDSNEFEQMNVINKLITRIRAEDTDSLSALMVSKKDDTRFGTTANWTEKLKIGFSITAAGVILLSVTIFLIAIIGPRKKVITTTEFSLRLQAWRLRQQLICQRLKNRMKKQEESPTDEGEAEIAEEE